MSHQNKLTRLVEKLGNNKAPTKQKEKENVVLFPLDSCEVHECEFNKPPKHILDDTYGIYFKHCGHTMSIAMHYSVAHNIHYHAL